MNWDSYLDSISPYSSLKTHSIGLYYLSNINWISAAMNVEPLYVMNYLSAIASITVAKSTDLL
jgi:hypothetical protein